MFTGLYLSNLKLGRRPQATDAFGEAVNYGLANNRLGVKFLFRPGSTAFDSGPASPPYDMWVTTDGHYHFVQAVLAGPRPQRFELVALAETALWPERPERAAAPARVA